MPQGRAIFANRGQLKDAPLAALFNPPLALKDATRKVVLVPTGLRYYDLRAGHQAGVKITPIPIPRIVADCLALGFLPTLDRIVNGNEVAARTRYRSVNARREIRALVRSVKQILGFTVL